jgi:hypothetical protein
LWFWDDTLTLAIHSEGADLGGFTLKAEIWYRFIDVDPVEYLTLAQFGL